MINYYGVLQFNNLKCWHELTCFKEKLDAELYQKALKKLEKEYNEDNLFACCRASGGSVAFEQELHLDTIREASSGNVLTMNIGVNEDSNISLCRANIEIINTDDIVTVDC